MIPAGLMINSVEIQASVRQSDGQGGWLEDHGTAVTVSGRIRPARGTEQIIGDQRKGVLTHVAYFNSDLVKKGDQLKSDDKIYKVLDIRNPGGMGHHWEIDCQEIQTSV